MKVEQLTVVFLCLLSQEVVPSLEQCGSADNLKKIFCFRECESWHNPETDISELLDIGHDAFNFAAKAASNSIKRCSRPQHQEVLQPPAPLHTLHSSHKPELTHSTHTHSTIQWFISSILFFPSLHALGAGLAFFPCFAASFFLHMHVCTAFHTCTLHSLLLWHRPPWTPCLAALSSSLIPITLDCGGGETLLSLVRRIEIIVINSYLWSQYLLT